MPDHNMLHPCSDIPDIMHFLPGMLKFPLPVAPFHTYRIVCLRFQADMEEAWNPPLQTVHASYSVRRLVRLTGKVTLPLSEMPVSV